MILCDFVFGIDFVALQLNVLQSHSVAPLQTDAHLLTPCGNVGHVLWDCRRRTDTLFTPAPLKRRQVFISIYLGLWPCLLQSQMDLSLTKITVESRGGFANLFVVFVDLCVA